MKRLVLLLVLTSVSCVYWTPMSRNISSAATVIPNVPMQKWDIKSCGAGALSTVLQHYGDATSMTSWEETLPKTRGGVMSIDLVLAARQKGYDAQLVTGDPSVVASELREGRPVILMLQVIQAPGKGYDFFHYVVLDGYDPGQNLVRTQFGDKKSRWTTFDRLESAWRGTQHATILIRPKDPMNDSLRAAVRLEDEGKYALAADAYREILSSHPDNVLAWTNLGNAEMRMDRRAPAEEAFRKAIALDGQAADALNNLAWLLYESSRYDEAESLARKAVVTQAPDAWTRYDTLARILAAKGECDQAQAAFKQAIDAVPAARTDDRAQLEAAAKNACKS